MKWSIRELLLGWTECFSLFVVCRSRAVATDFSAYAGLYALATVTGSTSSNSPAGATDRMSSGS